MSTADFVIPSLTNWTKIHINAIYSKSDSGDAVDKFLSKDAVIIINGKKTSRNDLKKDLQIEKVLEAGDSVSFVDIVQVPANKEDPVEVIGLLYFHDSNFA